jgi:predicted N-acyltransferase
VVPIESSSAQNVCDRPVAGHRSHRSCIDFPSLTVEIVRIRVDRADVLLITIAHLVTRALAVIACFRDGAQIYDAVWAGIIHQARLHYDIDGHREFVHSEMGVVEKLK